MWQQLVQLALNGIITGTILALTGVGATLIFGIQRQISLEFDKNISERVYIVVLTARVAVQVEETDAIVKYTNIGTV